MAAAARRSVAFAPAPAPTSSATASGLRRADGPATTASVLRRADGPATARARAEASALAALEDDDFFDYASLGHQVKGLVGNGGAFFDSHIISFIEPQYGRLIRVFVRRRDGKLGIGLNDANEVLDLPPAELCDGELKVFDRILSIDEVVVGPRKLCLLYTSPSPRDRTRSRMPSSA